MKAITESLIVDDKRTIAETLALVFSSGGYETQTA
jgi:CheY-like chemotaxis protein